MQRRKLETTCCKRETQRRNCRNPWSRPEKQLCKPKTLFRNPKRHFATKTHLTSQLVASGVSFFKKKPKNIRVNTILLFGYHILSHVCFFLDIINSASTQLEMRFEFAMLWFRASMRTLCLMDLRSHMGGYAVQENMIVHMESVDLEPPQQRYDYHIRSWDGTIRFFEVLLVPNS